MGKYISKKTVIDPETGEVLTEKSWLGYDGFTENGYRYRTKAAFIRYYFDSLPSNYDSDTLMLLFLIAELMNGENVLVYRVERKSKFSSIIYKPMTKDDIRERIRYKYGINKFDRCWRELTKIALKKIEYHDTQVWAVNPSIVSKCREIPFWLYEAFQYELNPHLSAITIKKLQARVDNYYR
jgi:hypothetical protein